MNITKSPEGAFVDHLWEILQEIQEKSFIYGPDKPVQWICEYQELGEKRMHEEAALIGKLKDWGIIKLYPEKTLLANNSNAYFYFERAYPLFQYAYSLLAAGRRHKTEPSNLLGMLQALSVTVQNHEEPPEDILKFIEDHGPDKETESRDSTSSVAKIDFNPITGIGCNGKTKFRLKDGSAEHRVFSRLYAEMNKRVLRYDVLELGRFYEDGEEIDPAREKDETEAINVIAKKIRKKVGLKTGQLVMNAGNLTLQGEKMTGPIPD